METLSQVELRYSDQGTLKPIWESKSELSDENVKAKRNKKKIDKARRAIYKKNIHDIWNCRK